MKKIILASLLLSSSAFAVESYYGQTRNSENCSIEINSLSAKKIRADFTFVYHKQAHEALGIPGKIVDQNTVQFKFGGTTAYLHLDDFMRPYQYDYTYDKAPNFHQVTCFFN